MRKSAAEVSVSSRAVHLISAPFCTHIWTSLCCTNCFSVLCVGLISIPTMSEEAWELCKENYVPVKSGRNKAALEELTDLQDGSSRMALEQRRKYACTKHAPAAQAQLVVPRPNQKHTVRGLAAPQRAGG